MHQLLSIHKKWQLCQKVKPQESAGLTFAFLCSGWILLLYGSLTLCSPKSDPGALFAGRLGASRRRPGPWLAGRIFLCMFLFLNWVGLRESPCFHPKQPEAVKPPYVSVDVSERCLPYCCLQRHAEQIQVPATSLVTSHEALGFCSQRCTSLWKLFPMRSAVHGPGESRAAAGRSQNWQCSLLLVSALKVQPCYAHPVKSSGKRMETG